MPAYEIRVYDRSNVEFVGIRNVRVLGTSAISMSHDQLQQVRRLIHDSGLTSIEASGPDALFISTVAHGEVAVSVDGKRKVLPIYTLPIARASSTLRKGLEAIFPIRMFRCPYPVATPKGIYDLCGDLEADEDKWFKSTE